MFYICNSSDLYCSETGKLRSNLDEYGPWSSNATTIFTYMMPGKGSFERCCFRGEQYYRHHITCDGPSLELYKPQPPESSIIVIERNQSINFLSSHVIWVKKAHGVRPHTAWSHSSLLGILLSYLGFFSLYFSSR